MTVTVVINVVTTSPATAASSSTTSSSAGSGATTSSGATVDTASIEGLLAVLAECTGGAPVVVVDVQDDPDLPDTVTAELIVNGVQMMFTYNNVTGSVGEGDRASAELLQACGVAG